MTINNITVHCPERAPRQLILLHHSLGAAPESMVPAGRRFARAYPHALIVSVGAPEPFDGGAGGQWFSLRGATEETRVQRVMEALPRFVDLIRAWQRHAGIGLEKTYLVGFSQGATMGLEALKIAPELAAHVVSVGGRFARLPVAPFPHTVVHLLHGRADPVVGWHHSLAAMECLMRLGSRVTLDILPAVGYEMDDSLLDVALRRLGKGDGEADDFRLPGYKRIPAESPAAGIGHSFRLGGRSAAANR